MISASACWEILRLCPPTQHCGVCALWGSPRMSQSMAAEDQQRVNFINRVCKQTCTDTSLWRQSGGRCVSLSSISPSGSLKSARSGVWDFQHSGWKMKGTHSTILGIMWFWSGLTWQVSAAWRSMLANYVGNYWSCFLPFGYEVITGDTYRVKVGKLAQKHTLSFGGHPMSVLESTPVPCRDAK